MPPDEPSNELLLRELGRINSELASQRRLNAMTVHDLSNPAQVILGLSEVLLEHQVLDPMVRKHLEQLHRSALTMTALITDLNHGFSLDDQDSLELERLDLVELVASVVERTHRLADAKDMRLTVLSDPSGPSGCLVDGDAIRLERALVNLLGNAIKFSPPGSQRHRLGRPRPPLRQGRRPRPGPGHQRGRQGPHLRRLPPRGQHLAPAGARPRAVHHQADRGEPRRHHRRRVRARRRCDLPAAGAAGRGRAGGSGLTAWAPVGRGAHSSAELKNPGG